MPGYLIRFGEAAQRTIRLGLSPPEFVATTGRILTPETLGRLANALGALDPHEVVAQCVSVHLRAQTVFEQVLRVPVTYTIGHVFIPPHYRFHQSEEDLAALLANPAMKKEVRLHTWLTLPTMEIADLVILTSLAVINGRQTGMGGVISRHADELADELEYVPMILGAEYLYRIGAVSSSQLAAPAGRLRQA